jgi:aspartate aminotransferase-like enzyme/predicted N-acetyltransferase YhbS
MLTAQAERARVRGVVRLATRSDHEAIHRLNYRTFVEEIPQHPPNAERRLIDRFHDENVYAVYVVDERVVGMVSGRAMRPFSLDQKLGPVDAWLPPYRRAVEMRLLAVEPAHRATRVFARLMRCITAHFLAQGVDLAVISGTTRQLALYRHLGFTPFGHLIGSPDAQYQPMYITRERLAAWPELMRDAEVAPDALPRGGNFLPGPVALSDAVQTALARPAISHRADAFLERHHSAQAQLRTLTGASHATLLLGSGTLANDVVAAQLAQRSGRGVIAVNGEFGERLVDHARRFGLDPAVVRTPWGAPLDFPALARAVGERPADWLWAVHSETSTGVVNDLERLRTIARDSGARLALDAISSIGAIPVSLDGVWMASAVSGKALAAYPGIAIVLHAEVPSPSSTIPRYLDLGHAAACGGVPFTQSSNLLEALATSLETTDWPSRIAQHTRDGAWLRNSLEQAGFTVLAPREIASAVVQTIVLPATSCARSMGEALREEGWLVSFESDYLRTRNWLQLCLMGENDPASIRRVVDALQRARG